MIYSEYAEYTFLQGIPYCTIFKLKLKKGKVNQATTQMM